MNAFAGSDQIAGTVTTHLISVILISVCCFLTSSNSEFTKNLSDSENTFRADIVFPVSSSTNISWTSDFKQKKNNGRKSYAKNNSYWIIQET